MDTNWASDHLQAIRTLMERSALYRRALAPVMTLSGCFGLIGAGAAFFLGINSARTFSLLWLCVGVVTMAASFLLVRKQALREAEAVWSPPTRRVALSLLPAFLVGLAAGTPNLVENRISNWVLACIWITSYGCALHAAGFFMSRGIKLFGWIFVLGGCTLALAEPTWSVPQNPHAANGLMGTFFGFLHLAYGVYLYFTEKQRART